MSAIGKRIQDRRMEKGISSAELARRCSISKGYLHSLENGEAQNPSVEILYKIATELGTTIADLMGEREAISKTLQLKDREIPQSLKDFAMQEQLPETDVMMLAGIQYRGKQPETVNDWRFIYESIKRTLK